MANVFISYSSQTNEEAKTLATNLSDMKYSVWSDNNLIPKGSYSEAIEGQLNEAKAIIVIWSAEATNSLWVKSEANQAARQGKLINTHVTGFNPDNIPRPFEQVHCVPVSDIAGIVKALRSMKIAPALKQLEPVTEAALRSEELLPFLKVCTTDELELLVQCTVKAWNADKIFEKNLVKHPLYPEHSGYVEEIDRQFRLLGGHAISNLFRGSQGPTYREILLDLCHKAKLEAGGGHTVIEMEKKLLIRAFDDAFARLTPEQKVELADSINDELKKRGSQWKFDQRLKGPAAAIMAQAGVNMTGFLIYKTSAILLNAFAKAFLGKGLTFAANATAMRVLGVAAGPVGWIATGLYTVYDVTRPAYRDLELGVLQIAALREVKLYGDGDTVDR